MLDVAIVGGGPAGSMAARALARSHDVLVIEEHPVSGVPMQCAGLLTERTISMSGVSPDIYARLTRAKVLFPDGSEILLEPDSTFACVVDRTDLDRRMAEAAMDAGAEFRYRTAYKSHTYSGCNVIDTTGGEVRSRAIVGADGHSSKVAASLGGNLPREYIRGIEADVAGTWESPDTLTIRMGLETAPGFFSWEMPCGDFTRVGLCTSWEYGPPYQYLMRLIDRVSPGARILAKYSGKIPLGGRRAMSGDGCILTGDAAGLVKPVSGGGLYPTFKTAPILESVLSEALEADDLSARRLSRYDRECMKAVGRELRHGYSLRKRLVRMSDEDICYAAQLSRRESISCHLKGIDLDSPSGVIKEILKDPRNIPPILKMAVRFRP